ELPRGIDVGRRQHRSPRDQDQQGERGRGERPESRRERARGHASEESEEAFPEPSHGPSLRKRARRVMSTRSLLALARTLSGATADTALSCDLGKQGRKRGWVRVDDVFFIELRKKIDAALDKSNGGAPEVVVDLSGVRHIDSRGLGGLLIEADRLTSK